MCINQHLIWGNHIAYATHKASHILNLLRRTMYSCNKTSKKVAVTALVRPHLEYCAPVWSPHYTKDKLALEKVQKRAAHWICSKWDNAKYKWNNSYGQALSELHRLPETHLARLLSKIQDHQLHGLYCQYFSFITRSTRYNSQVLSCVQSRVNAFRYSYFVNAPYAWNCLPNDIIYCSSMASFNHILTRFLLSQ